MRALIVLLGIILWNIVFVELFDEKFEKMLPFSLMSAALCVYLSGLLGNLLLGVLVIGVLLLVFSGIKVKQYWKTKKWKFRKEKIVTAGFVATIVFYVILVLVNRVRGFNHWDDYMHWGAMLKYNLEFNQFYAFDQMFIFAHKDYPPIASLFESIWCYLSGGYNEALAMRAIQFLEGSFILVIFSKMSLEKKQLPNIVLGLFIVLVPILLLPDLSLFYFNSLYVDSLIGIIFGFGLYFVFNHQMNMKNGFLLSILLSFLVLLKQVGLAFCGLLLCALVLKFIVTYKKGKVKEKLLVIAMAMGIPAMFYLSWKAVINMADVNGSLVGQFSYGDLKIFDIFRIIQGTGGEGWQIETANLFIQALMKRPMFYQPIQLSFVASMVLIDVIMVGICLIYKKDQKAYAMKCAVYNVGAIGYAFCMLLLYVFAFGPYEGPILASFERYMATYIYAGVLLIIFTVVDDFEVNWKTLGSISLALILFIPIHDYSRLKPSTSAASWGDGLLPFVDLIKSNVSENENVLMMEQGEKAIHHYIMGYYLMPIEMNAYSFGPPKYEDDIYSVDFTQEEFDALLANYDYFYLYMFDDVGNQLLSKYCKEEDIQFSKLFKIQKEQGVLSLVPVN